MTFSFFSERYINPLSVFGIKRLFNTESNKDLLIDFLNSIINLSDENRICDVQFLNPEQLDTIGMERNSVFDVYCKTKRDEYFLVEMQNEPAIFFWERSIFYSAFPIHNQIIEGKKWKFKLDAIYAIGLLNFCFCDGSEDDGCYLHNVPMKDTKALTVYDNLTFIFAELPKFKKKENELDTQLDKWLYTLNNLSEFEKQPAVLSGKIFDKLFQVTDTKNFTSEETQAYSFSEKYYLDYVNSIRTAVERGRQKGEQQDHEITFEEVYKRGYKNGYDYGHIEGFQKGFCQGIELVSRRTAKAMKQQGYSDEAIAMIMKASQTQ